MDELAEVSHPYHRWVFYNPAFSLSWSGLMQGPSPAALSTFGEVQPIEHAESDLTHNLQCYLHSAVRNECLLETSLLFSYVHGEHLHINTLPVFNVSFTRISQSQQLSTRSWPSRAYLPRR
jgi:hypothetical protein